jgi:hypothetical protein
LVTIAQQAIGARREQFDLKGLIMERISGPFNGFYIASCACKTVGPGESFLGYSKICRDKPDNYWEAHCFAKIAGEQVHPNPRDAVVDVERQAREQTGNLARWPASAQGPAEHPH